jgi:hypothetical protein
MTWPRRPQQLTLTAELERAQRPSIEELRASLDDDDQDDDDQEGR